LVYIICNLQSLGDYVLCFISTSSVMRAVFFTILFCDRYILHYTQLFGD